MRFRVKMPRLFFSSVLLMLADDGVRFIEGGDSIGELPGDVDDPKLAAPIALTNPLSQMSMLRTQPVVGGTHL